MSKLTLTSEIMALVAERFKALGEPARLQILSCLRAGEMAVIDLVEETGFGQANVSKHLRLLHSLGFVRRRKDGLFVYYALADSGHLPAVRSDVWTTRAGDETTPQATRRLSAIDNLELTPLAVEVKRRLESVLGALGARGARRQWRLYFFNKFGTVAATSPPSAERTSWIRKPPRRTVRYGLDVNCVIALPLHA